MALIAYSIFELEEVMIRLLTLAALTFAMSFATSPAPAQAGPARTYTLMTCENLPGTASGATVSVQFSAARKLLMVRVTTGAASKVVSSAFIHSLGNLTWWTYGSFPLS